jgi:hypothetical protein
MQHKTPQDNTTQDKVTKHNKATQHKFLLQPVGNEGRRKHVLFGQLEKLHAIKPSHRPYEVIFPKCRRYFEPIQHRYILYIYIYIY